MSLLATAAPPDATPPHRRAPTAWLIVVLVVISLVAGLGAGYALWHRAWPKQLNYSGRLASICGGARQMAPGQGCMAIALDPGTIRKDACYSGAGDLSLPGLGPGFWGMHGAFPPGGAPRVGDHVRVVVLDTLGAGCTPVDIYDVNGGIP